jgi:phage tail sheath protein FI
MPEFLHGVEVVEIDDGIRPIRTVRSSIIGIVGTAPDAEVGAFPLDQPVLVTGPRQAAALGAEGTLRDAYDAIYAQGASVAIVVRVDEGADAAETMANVVGETTAQTGCFALLTAQTVVRQTPRILCAPGFTGSRDADANPVATALVQIADRLRAVAVADGPNQTEVEALAYVADFDSDRLYVVDPHVRAFDPLTAQVVSRPPSAYAAGAIAARDIERGFWWSPSNTALGGVVGIARPIEFHLSDTQTEANRLNEGNVATVVHQNGFRLWGNRTPTTDPLWSFLPVRRTADLIYDSIERAHLWAMDRPQSAQLIVDVRDSVQAYLDQLVSLGALLGGRVWFDPELNTPATMMAGQVYLDFDIEPPAPLERLTFRAHRNGDYYETLALEVAATN